MQIKCARPQITAGLINYSDLVFPGLLLRNIAAIILSKYSRVQGLRCKNTKHKQQQSVTNKCDKMKQTNSESVSRAAVTTNTTPRTSSPDSVTPCLLLLPLLLSHLSPKQNKMKKRTHNRIQIHHWDISFAAVHIPELLQQLTHDCRDKYKKESEREVVEAGLGADKNHTYKWDLTREEGFSATFKAWTPSAKNITTISAQGDK